MFLRSSRARTRQCIRRAVVHNDKHDEFPLSGTELADWRACVADTVLAVAFVSDGRRHQRKVPLTARVGARGNPINAHYS